MRESGCVSASPASSAFYQGSMNRAAPKAKAKQRQGGWTDTAVPLRLGGARDRERERPPRKKEGRKWASIASTTPTRQVMWPCARAQPRLVHTCPRALGTGFVSLPRQGNFFASMACTPQAIDCDDACILRPFRGCCIFQVGNCLYSSQSSSFSRHPPLCASR